MQRLVDWCLPVIFVLGLGAIVLANPDPLARNALCDNFSFCFRSADAAFWNNLAYEIGLAASASIFFYWLLVSFPEIRKRRRLRKYLLSSYKCFRRDAIYQFLFASDRNGVDPDLVDSLNSQSAFRAYFSQPSTRVQGDKWHDVANGLEPHHRRELFIIMSILRDDIQYVLNNTDLSDDEAFDIFHGMSKSLAAHDPRSADYDDDKMMLRLFWQIMAGWNLISGYEQEDRMLRVIRSI